MDNETGGGGCKLSYINCRGVIDIPMPGTHFAAGWAGDPYLPVPKAVFELTNLK